MMTWEDIAIAVAVFLIVLTWIAGIVLHWW